MKAFVIPNSSLPLHLFSQPAVLHFIPSKTRSIMQSSNLIGSSLIKKKMSSTTQTYVSKTTAAGPAGEVPFEHLEIQDKDLESDEALWDLYERWAVHYEVERDNEEKNKRFDLFKTRAKSIHEFNKTGHSWTEGLNQFTDWTEEEMRCYC